MKKRILALRTLKELFWITGSITGGIAAGLAAVYFFGIFAFDGSVNPSLIQATILYDRTGERELYRLYDEANRQIIPHDAIPDSVRLATIASEDERFYSHYGVDLFAIGRAAIVNLRSKEIEQGASTITQQLSRSLFLTRDQTWQRKIKEVFLALKVESHFSKEEILDLYLNTIPYGSNAYGIETAAQTFFDKSASDLTLSEGALLAALPNAPTLYSPYGKDNSALIARQKSILQKMRDLDFISDEEQREASAIDIMARITPPKRPIIAPHFVFFVKEQLEKEYGDTLPTAGLRVLTTLDYDLQLEAENAVRIGADKNKVRGAENAALVALDSRTGEILSMVGSKDYFDPTIDGEVNIITSLRQPGSSFKPIVYAAAFEKGFQPETPIFDIPIDFGPDGQGERYIPNNYDGNFRGKITMRQSLAQSLNIPAVTTLALTGLDETIAFATRLGITTLTDPKRYGLSLVLGGAEVRPLDMASAFSVFSQEGEHIVPTPILSIEKNGEPVPPKTMRVRERIINVDIARKINSILSDNQARSATFGTASPLAFPKGVSVAAKTGTTQNFRDAWTVGYTPSISVAVWAGNNDNRPMAEGSDGIYVAAPIWRSFMDKAIKRFPEESFIPYEKTKEEFIFGNNLSGFGVLGATGSDIHYFDRKTDREITEAEARDLKDSRVKRISTIDLLLKNAGVREGNAIEGLVSIDVIKQLYLPPKTSVIRP